MGGLLGLILASIFAGRANRTARMKLIHSVLRNKRDRVEKVRREIEALQIAIPLLIEDHAGKDSFSSTRAGHQLSA
jgi:hypothetical protein